MQIHRSQRIQDRINGHKLAKQDITQTQDRIQAGRQYKQKQSKNRRNVSDQIKNEEKSLN